MTIPHVPISDERLAELRHRTTDSFYSETWNAYSGRELIAEIDRLRLENHQLRVAQSIIERECDTRRHILPPGITADDLRAELDDLESHAVRWAEGGRFVCIRVCVDHLLSLLEPGEKKA